jgi:hypothetical protein
MRCEVIEVTQGDDKAISFALLDSAGAPLSLVGCTLFVSVKKRYSDTDAAAAISGTLTVAVPALGVGVWTLVPADTVHLLGEYYMDIQLKTAAAKIYTVYRGILSVLPQVTIRTS